jgi:glycine oxidase
MKNVDYIIVGLGVAGSCFALKLLQEKKSFLVIDENKFNASSVAVGIYNPVVLKRFSLIWRAQKQIDLLHSYFQSFEKLLGGNYLHAMPTYRILSDDNEIHAWTKKSSLPELIPFIDSKIQKEVPAIIHAPNGFAEVKQTGRVELGKCIHDFRRYLVEQNLLIQEKFDFNQLKISDDKIEYQDIESPKIIFSEGFGIKENPYFNYLPIIGVKGEVLKIKLENEVPFGIWKAHNFLLKTEPGMGLTASTYDRDDLSPEPTEKGKNEIIARLQEIYSGEFEVIEHLAGIRPTVLDRRPVIGAHPKFHNLYLLNGMGTRGTLLGPDMTEELYAFIEHHQPIDKESDLRRFTKKHYPND